MKRVPFRRWTLTSDDTLEHEGDCPHDQMLICRRIESPQRSSSHAFQFPFKMILSGVAIPVIPTI
jgi:hypothetical protein